MERPFGQAVNIWELIPGEQYYAFSNKQRHSIRPASRFRGTFTGYFVNDAGYNMIRFHYVHYKDADGFSNYIGDPENFPKGSYWRIFEDHRGPQTYSFYRLSRFSTKLKNELATRVVLRTRRQLERGLTGTNEKGLWLPRDIVREISLKYLTDPKVGCAGRWR